MRKRFGSGTMQLSRIISALFSLDGLTLLGGMVWHVGLTGLVASCEALSLRIDSCLLLDSIAMLLHTEGGRCIWPAGSALSWSASLLAGSPLHPAGLRARQMLPPQAVSSGAPGHEIEGPMALVILGGLITSTALNLLVLPTLALCYGRFEGKSQEI